jgi:hypothetical protein
LAPKAYETKAKNPELKEIIGAYKLEVQSVNPNP